MPTFSDQESVGVGTDSHHQSHLGGREYACGVGLGNPSLPIQIHSSIQSRESQIYPKHLSIAFYLSERNASPFPPFLAVLSIPGLPTQVPNNIFPRVLNKNSKLGEERNWKFRKLMTRQYDD